MQRNKRIRDPRFLPRGARKRAKNTKKAPSRPIPQNFVQRRRPVPGRDAAFQNAEQAPGKASSHAKSPCAKHPDGWTTGLWEKFLQNRRILKKKNLLFPRGYAIIIERDCTKICDEAGGCRRRRGISAEYVRFQTGRPNTVDMLDVPSGRFSLSHFDLEPSSPGQTAPLERCCFGRFFNVKTRNTRNSVQLESSSHSKKVISRRRW